MAIKKGEARSFVRPVTDKSAGPEISGDTGKITPKKDRAKIRTVYFDNDLWRVLKIVAVNEESTITKILEQAAREYLLKYKKIEI